MISFIILHYKNISDTIECIESIKKLDRQKEISIIIVDNNSLTDSELESLENYTDDIILSEYNLGVSKAYNLGSKYAIEKYHPDYLCVLNNDIIINQENFVELVEKTYKNYKFDALGPKIICPGDSVNPFPVFDSLESVAKRIERNDKLIDIYSNSLKSFIFEFALNIKRIFKRCNKLENGEKLIKGCALHGCFIIFSKKYYKAFDEVMLPDTFLFHEEEYLYFRIIKNKLISIYNPKIEIIHKEGQALKRSNTSSRKRKLNKLIEANKSLNILKDKLVDDDNFR